MSRRKFEDVLVRFSAGTHTTSTVRGERASSTMGFDVAATALGQKLFGRAFVSAERIGQLKTHGAEHWRLIYRDGALK